MTAIHATALSVLKPAEAQNTEIYNNRLLKWMLTNLQWFKPASYYCTRQLVSGQIKSKTWVWISVPFPLSNKEMRVECSPAQVWQRGTKEGTVQEGVVVLYDFDQLVFRTQHPWRHICKQWNTPSPHQSQIQPHPSNHPDERTNSINPRSNCSEYLSGYNSRTTHPGRWQRRWSAGSRTGWKRCTGRRHCCPSARSGRWWCRRAHLCSGWEENLRTKRPIKASCWWRGVLVAECSLGSPLWTNRIL